MSRRVSVIVACDNCDTDSTEKKPVTPHVITIEKVTRRIDLCGVCEEGLISPIRSVLFEAGVDPEPEDLGEACPLCGASVVTRKALSTHLRDIHDSGIRQMISEGKLEPARKKA